jgi:hypothetical protein
MTADKPVEFQVCLSNTVTEATTRSIAYTDCIVHQLERAMYCITSNEQMQFRKELSIHLIEFEAWGHAIGVQELQITIEQHAIHLGYPMMHHLSHMLESIRQIGSGNNPTSNISEWLDIFNVSKAYRSTIKGNHIQQMLKHNEWSTGLDYMEEAPPYLGLQRWYNIDWADVLN